MSFGEREIPWLTKEERGIFDYFDKLICVGRNCTKNDKTNRIWSIFWLVNSISALAVMTWTIWHFRNNFDIAAYGIHHWVLFIDDVTINAVLYLKRRDVRYVIETSKKTYEYDSELINGFAKNLIGERIRKHRVMGHVLTWTAIGILTEVEVFFIIEELVFKTYRSIYPTYIGLDLDDPIVYSSVVFWQQVICYYTTCMPLMVITLAYVTWSHLDLEIEILKFAISHIEDVVKEQLQRPANKDGKGKTEQELYEVYVYHFAKHHASIIKYFNKFASAMSIATTFVFFTGFCLMVTVGLSTLSDNTGIKLKLQGFLLVQTLVIYGWCWIGQYIGDKGDEVKEAVSGAPWWLMPKKCRSTLFLMILGCQNRLSLTTPFGHVANKECFMDLAKAVYQCISVVFQMRQEL